MGVGEVGMDSSMSGISTSVPSTEAEADQLLASIEGSEQEQHSSTESPPTASQFNQEEFLKTFQDELKWGNETKKLPYSDIKRYAQMGYAFNEKNRQSNQERSQWMQEVEKTKQEFAQKEQVFGSYQQVDDFAKANPGWWEHVRTSYEKTIAENPNYGQSVDPLAQRLNEFEKKITDKFGFIDQLENRFKQEEVSKQDQQLEQEVESYKSKYPELDWKTVNDNGFSRLELEVIDFGIQNGIKNFKIAADAFLKDKLLDMAQAKARTNVGKELQKNAKLGLGPKTFQPTKGLKKIENTNVSWEAMKADDILEEFGIK